MTKQEQFDNWCKDNNLVPPPTLLDLLTKPFKPYVRQPKFTKKKGGQSGEMG